MTKDGTISATKWPWIMLRSIYAAITKYHRVWVICKQQTFISHSSRCWEVQDQVPAGVSGEGMCLQLHPQSS
jgi:hypothetical protein